MSRPKLFAMPSRAELKRAALLSLVVTLVSLAWPVAALAQDLVTQTGGQGAALSAE